MPIRWDKRNARWRFEFNRVVEGSRHRASRLLPAGWSRTEAESYDRIESSRIYAIATGVRRQDSLIDEAVMEYLKARTDMKSHHATTQHLAAVAWAYIGRPLSAFPDVARQITEHESARGMKPATVKNRLACLKAACRYGWKRGMCESDPTTRLEMPAVRNERQVYITRKDMLRACKATTNWQAQIAIRVAFYSGMRLGELFRVHVEKDMLVLADTKNGDRRAIPAHRRIRHLLRYLPLAGPKITIQRAWERGRDRAKLGSVTFHDLRHSAASEMVNAGVDLYTVGQVLGHRDSRSTKRYSHLTAGTLADAVGKIGKRAA